ncbi:hypothetical protein DENSPDRAFT_620822 [Dentipellis sp. KUC8613]|nr:hypothetical protein DENSPDRAFT_620822 [Dentipellis sp. KUC8613]
MPAARGSHSGYTSMYKLRHRVELQQWARTEHRCHWYVSYKYCSVTDASMSHQICTHTPIGANSSPQPTQPLLQHLAQQLCLSRGLPPSATTAPNSCGAAPSR